MPKYSFSCNSCGNKKHKYVSPNIEQTHCYECGGTMKRDMPKLEGPVEVRETVDTYTGATWNQNHKEMIQQRREQHYWEVEVPRLVEKYSLETCLENGWLTYNEKGDLVINKPPSKR